MIIYKKTIIVYSMNIGYLMIKIIYYIRQLKIKQIQLILILIIILCLLKIIFILILKTIIIKLIGWQAYRGDHRHRKNSPYITLKSNPGKVKKSLARPIIHLK